MNFRQLLEVQSSSTDSKNMWEFILAELALMQGIKVEIENLHDSIKGHMKNIFVTKGKSETYPVFACHTDTVHKLSENVKAYKSGDVWFCMNFSQNGAEQVGTGGDDKCGIYTCFEMLERLEAVKCIFYSFEESGCLGSKASDYTLEFTKD